MNIKATKFYYVIKIAKDKQAERKDKIGLIVIPPQYVFMTRNMQCGNIVSIGDRVKAGFPQAKEGDILICHHFIEDDDFLIHTDKEYNYYAVWGVKEEGKPNRAYGIFNGETIIPHEDYVFLKTDPPADNSKSPDEYINDALMSTGSGLLVFRDWKMTTQEKIDKMADLKKRNETLSHGGVNKPHIIEAIRENERRMESISKELNKDSYAPYEVAYANPLVSQWCDKHIGDGSILYMQTRGCQTKVEFMGKEYIMADTKFIGFCYNQ